MRFGSQGMAFELSSGSPEKEGMPREIHRDSHKVQISPVFTLFEPDRKPPSLHEARKKIELRGLT